MLLFRRQTCQPLSPAVFDQADEEPIPILLKSLAHLEEDFTLGSRSFADMCICSLSTLAKSLNGMDKAASRGDLPFIRQASLITGQGGAKETQSSGVRPSAIRRQAYQFRQAAERRIRPRGGSQASPACSAELKPGRLIDRSRSSIRKMSDHRPKLLATNDKSTLTTSVPHDNRSTKRFPNRRTSNGGVLFP